MNTKEKSLKLAELMGWETFSGTENTPNAVNIQYIRLKYGQSNIGGQLLNPYCTDSVMGHSLSQFAAILLKFPEVLGHSLVYGCRFDGETMQANILDEILRMNGINPDA